MNTEEKQAFYQAFRSKDARFDGRFFIGVKSTGIYCRPVCRARLPKPENCEYFRTASEAEQAGYRPCLLCRPELAPGSSPIDASSQLAWRAAGLLRENCGSGINLPALAGELGCTDRHLRRVFRQTCHVTPVQYLQTCRLLLAKELLTDTSLPVLDIAMAAGFGSVRRMNELFQKQYHMTPTRLRRESAAKASDGALAVSIGYRPPYNWPAMLTFLRQRAIPGIERVENDGYERTVGIRSRTGELCKGWLRVENVPGRNMLRAVFSESLVPVLPQVLAGVRHLFDTDCDPALIGETLEDMNTPICIQREHACRAVLMYLRRRSAPSSGSRSRYGRPARSPGALPGSTGSRFRPAAKAFAGSSLLPPISPAWERQCRTISADWASYGRAVPA